MPSKTQSEDQDLLILNIGSLILQGEGLGKPDQFINIHLFLIKIQIYTGKQCMFVGVMGGKPAQTLKTLCDINRLKSWKYLRLNRR